MLRARGLPHQESPAWASNQADHRLDLYTDSDHLGVKSPIEIPKTPQHPLPGKTFLCIFAELATVSQSPKGHPRTHVQTLTEVP